MISNEPTSFLTAPTATAAAWTPPARIRAASLVGTYVQIDPLDLDHDVPPLFEALGGDEGINDRLKWFGKPPMDVNGFHSLLETISEEEGSVNIFRLVSTGEVVGMASYIAIVPQHGSVEVGYVGHGLAMARSPVATEAHYLLAKHAIETCGYRRYEWKCDSRNEPSKACAKRLGFQYEGCFRQHRMTPTYGNRDTSWFSILDKEWPGRKEEFEKWLAPTNFDESGNQLCKLQDFRTSS